MENEKGKKWMRQVLKVAAVYNLIWGAWVLFLPNHFFELAGMELPTHPSIWQGMGMVIGVYGLGYWWASYAPIRHWPIVFVGFLGKFFGPIGFLWSYLNDKIPLAFGLNLLTNDLIWWIPFLLILKAVHKSGWKLTSDG